MQSFSCEYICNYLVAQVFLKKNLVAKFRDDWWAWSVCYILLLMSVRLSYRVAANKELKTLQEMVIEALHIENIYK